jgi:predicted transposase/invertase (TIGR01784 family)
MFPDNEDFHFRFEMRDVRHPKLSLTDDMSLHLFELPKFERIMKNRQMKDALDEWLHFFNHAHEEDKTMRTAYKNPAIHKAFDILETLSADETVRHLARVREDALRNERSELFYAEKKGLEKGRKETARNLLSMGVLTPEQIAQATGLTAEEIRKLKKRKRKISESKNSP